MRFVTLFLCALVLGSCSRVASSSSLPAPLRAAARTGGFKSVYEFSGSDGAKPFAGLVVLNKAFYGTTLFGGSSSACGAEGCGTVFTLSPRGTENVIYSFQGNADGENPFGGLTKLNGTLYGITQAGGTHNDGTVFAIAPSGSKRTLYSFAGSTSDGKGPMATLLSYNGILYGTTEYGGANGFGTVFAIMPSGKETVLYSFAGQPDGASPRSGLVVVNGTLYGTTEYGGSGACPNYNPAGCGTVFSITTTGQEEVTYSFGQAGSDGTRPLASLVNAAGMLYGTTWSGGANGDGTVYQITLTGQESVIYSFAGTPDGANPFAGLTYFKGTLYGTTSSGGVGGTGCPPSDNGCGTVFSMTASGVESVLYSFQGNADGESPEAGLATFSGNLYGSAAEGGQGCANTGPGCGTIFRLTP
jgi:uncharacterized repeat protein (TIGR03803 family)